jgi:16S rRNA (guanine527-N7)-methyltransferase
MTADAEARLHAFAALLRRWNSTLNLIAPRDIDVLWERHIADSLQLVPLMPQGVTRGIDLGTGGGFPGLVLAIATGVPFDLIESDRRKASFLRTAVLETGAAASVHCCRIEQATVPAAALVTARALAPLPRLLPMVARLLTTDGTCLLLKGAKAQEELEAAGRDWTMTVEQSPSRTSAEGVVLRLTGLRPRQEHGPG